MREIIHRLTSFFTIDNPLLIIFFLFLILLSRFNVTYFNETHTVVAPDVGFYAGEFVGHDLLYATTDQVARMKHGLPMDLGVGYGYTFTLITAVTTDIFYSIGVCSPLDRTSCDFLFYKLIVLIALVLLVSLVFILVKQRSKQIVALLFFTAFILGVPGSMGIESGNLDILLSGIFGLMLFLQKKSVDQKQNMYYPLLLGAVAGALIQTKLFFIPVAVIFLICSTSPLLFFIAALTTAGIITILPGFYGTPINPLYTFQAAQYLRQATVLSSELVYGNNDTRAMVGGVVFAIPYLKSNDQASHVLINLGGIILFVTMLISPLFMFRKELMKKLLINGVSERLKYSCFIVLTSYAVMTMILWPEVSLGYRLYYLIPLMFVLIDSSQTQFAKHSLGLAIASLLTRSLFVWHSRILHVFLLGFFYFFIVSSLSIWLKPEDKTIKSDKNSSVSKKSSKQHLKR